MPEYIPVTWATTDLIYSARATAMSAKVDEIEQDNTVQFARMDKLQATSITTIPRAIAAGTGTAIGASQALALSYFTADQNLTVNNVYTRGGSTAAGATPTLVRFGLYTVASNGDLTLVASTANDTTLFSSANSSVNKALSASYNMVAGQRYAAGWLVVSAAAIPTIISTTSILPGSELAIEPRLMSQITGQSNLPSSVANASLSTFTGGVHYYRLYT